MAIDFPNSPSTGDLHTVNGKQWQWDAEKWIAYGVSLAPDVLKVDSGNNRVGINQTSPAYSLDVTGTARITGDLTVQGTTTTIESAAVNTSLVFEGATADAYETTLTLVDPTADRTITLPDTTGTVALTTDLAPYATLASPTLTGVPAAPTAAANTSTTQVATTAFVMTEVGDYAPLASPTLTGTPAAPTASANTNTTQVATTAFVMTEVGDYLTTATAASTYSPLASPTFTGTVNAAALVAPLAFNTQTASYTLVLADAGKAVLMNVGSANNLTIPPNSSVAFDVGTQIIVTMIGAGVTTIVDGSGVTTNSKDNAAALDGQFTSVSLVKTATDTWLVTGALA